LRDVAPRFIAPPAVVEKDKAEVNPRDVPQSGSIKTLSFGLPKPLNGASASGGGGTFSLGSTGRYLGFDLLGGLNVQTTDYGGTDAKGVAKKTTVNDYSALAALRLRGQVQSRYFGAALAVGPGVVYRVVGKQADGKGVFSIPDAAQAGPALAITGDLSGHLRLTESTDLTVGTMLWIEPAGLSGTADRGDLKVARGGRVTAMPYVGFHFGP
jgi:hypothetical protein